MSNEPGLRVVAEHRMCLNRRGLAARLLRGLVRVTPLRTLGRVLPAREDFFYRGRLLFATDYVVVLEPRMAVVAP